MIEPEDFKQFLEAVQRGGFAWRDLLGQDAWSPWTVAVSLTVVGTPTYTGRFRIVGKMCYFQATLVSTVSIASTAGTSYVTLPRTASGLAGVSTFTNNTTNVAAGVCHVDVATSRVYLPTLVASADTFTLAGWFEIA